MDSLTGAAASAAAQQAPGFIRGHWWSLRTGAGARVRKWYRRSRGAQVALLVVVMVATAMVIGDGVLTPSISGAFRGWFVGPWVAISDSPPRRVGVTVPGWWDQGLCAARSHPLPLPTQPNPGTTFTVNPVLSAISGIKVATDKISQPAILGITIAVLVLLFRY